MRLRGFCTLLLLTLFAIGCTSASKFFKRGKYDDAITASIRVLNREPSNQKHLDILRDAYRVADAEDKTRILTLKETGEPDIWGNIITIYERMIARNRKVEALPSSVKNVIDFVYQSHGEELTTAKQRATEYHYATGIQRLNLGTKTEARQAFAHFEKVVLYSGANYRDVRELRARAEELGTTFVLFSLVNRTATFLPPDAIWHLTNVHPESMNKRWVKYDTEPRRSSYQYEITFTLERNIWYPTTASTKRFTETRTITDGTEYKTDSKGKPVLDSNGNFIKIPKTVTLKCVVAERIQQRKARLDGSLTYFDVENQRVVRMIPLTRTVVANSSRFTTTGDLRALSDQTRRRITAPFVPLPQNDELIIWASRDLGEQIRQALIENAHVVR